MKVTDHIINICRRNSSLATAVYFLLDLVARFLTTLSGLIGKIYSRFFVAFGTSWFDHRFDYLRGVDNYRWAERGFLALRKIKKGDKVLDVGCGDGIFDSVYYSRVAAKILAIDKDVSAIRHARSFYSKKNVKFAKCDVLRQEFPGAKFDIILMFAVIEHFYEEDGLKVLVKIKSALKPGGIFFGSTPVLKNKGVSNWEHKNEFESVRDLRLFLLKVFKRVKIEQNRWTAERTECYFECAK